jgi:hypothetical protein
MKAKTLFFLIPIALLAAGLQISSGATIPAGTILIVRTASPVSSVDPPGRAVPFQLGHPIAVNGKTLIPAGTHLGGKVATSRRLVHAGNELTVDVTSVHLAGHDIPLSTTGPQFLSNDIKTRNNTSISRSNYTVAAGKLMQFKLARPLVF